MFLKSMNFPKQLGILKACFSTSAPSNSTIKNTSSLEGLTFVSLREKKYAARKINCSGKAPGQAFHALSEFLKEDKLREKLKEKQRHIVKGEAERGRLYRWKKHLFNHTVYEKSTIIAAIDACIHQ